MLELFPCSNNFVRAKSRFGYVAFAPHRRPATASGTNLATEEIHIKSLKSGISKIHKTAARYRPLHKPSSQSCLASTSHSAQFPNSSSDILNVIGYWLRQSQDQFHNHCGFQGFRVALRSLQHPHYSQPPLFDERKQFPMSCRCSPYGVCSCLCTLEPARFGILR